MERYHKAKEMIGEDPRWTAMDEAYRETVYLRFLKEKRDRMREARREHRDDNIRAFKQLLMKYKVKVGGVSSLCVGDDREGVGAR